MAQINTSCDNLVGFLSCKAIVSAFYAITSGACENFPNALELPDLGGSQHPLNGAATKIGVARLRLFSYG